ncbi:MAG: leucine-rich repeat domain-containing protein [Acholeplasmatales bacterium]|nr:leucine-rich repeat domain-containing protein [Acholeplasmatales bacterium]
MIQYEIQGKMAVITGTTTKDVNLTIPQYVEGNITVSKIEGNSFQEMEKLKKVTIPGSVKVIGAYSFAECKLLKEVILEEGVEVIEDWAFINCNIEKIKLPSTIKSIGTNAFLGNMCKYEVEEIMKEKSQGKKARSHTNYRSAVFPLSLLEAKENINSEIIESRARYIDSQLDMVEAGTMPSTNLDLPFLFNNDEFLVAYYSKNKEVSNISFDVASESKTQIGLYSEADPDFLTLKINILSDETILSSFYMKTPYLEDIKLHNNGVEHVESKGEHYYFISVRLNMKCYGTGNINREFSINLFNELTGKYQTEVQNGLLAQEQFQDIRDEIDQKILEVTDGFVSQLDGCPMHTYVYNLYRYCQNDEGIERRGEIDSKIFELLLKYYNEITDIDSLDKMCFVDCFENLKFLEAITGMTHEELSERYDYHLQDAMGVNISVDEALSYRDLFKDLETNYNLHADFLLYIYKELQRLNNQFSVIAFAA